MFFTSRKKQLTSDAREIQIGDNSNMPQLYRLCTDFGFAVLGLRESSKTPKNYVLCEVGLLKNNDSIPEKVSPEFTTLCELETYVTDHMVEIIQKYLFGEDQSTENNSVGNSSSVA